MERADILPCFSDRAEAGLRVLDWVCLISPSNDNNGTVTVLILHHRSLSVASFFGHTDDLFVNGKEIIIVNTDKLIEEVLDLSYEEKVSLLDLIRNLLLSASVEG